MTAIIYNFERPRENAPIDETERLFSALGRHTSAELLELLYVGEEPGFFELMRGLFGLSDEDRSVLQNFLASHAAAVGDGDDRPGGPVHSCSQGFYSQDAAPKSFLPEIFV